MSLNDIYQKDKKYNGFKTGDSYGLIIDSDKGSQGKIMKVVAVGINNLILRDDKNRLKVVTYTANTH
jgi:hypothetical protein